MEGAGSQLQALGIGLLQLVVALAIASIALRYVRRSLRSRLRDSPSPRALVLAENGATAGIYLVALTIVLALWGLTWTALVTALSISTVAVAFGFQDLLRSLVGGVLVIFERPFAIGDRIKIRDAEGKVERIDLRTTVIRTDAGDRIVVPNALVFSDPVTNMSPNRARFVLQVTGLQDQPGQMKQVALAALAGLPGLESEIEIHVRTKHPKKRLRSALDALPGMDAERVQPKESVGVGMRIAWSGQMTSRAEAKRRLQSAFPNARIGTGRWY